MMRCYQGKRWLRGHRRLPMLLLALMIGLAACGESGTETDGAADDGGGDAPAEEPADEPAAQESTEETSDNQDEGQGDWPTSQIRLVVPSDTGGSFDRQARGLEPLWEERLGVDIVVDNQPGGNNAVGTTIVAQEGADCETLLYFSTPSMAFSYLIQDVDYTYDDFYPLAQVQFAPWIIIVPNDSPYESFNDLIEDARERPGEVTASTPATTSPSHLGLLRLEEELDVEFNKVAYDGGGPSRVAVQAGEVDFSHAPLFGSLDFADEIRFLAIHQPENRWTELADVPTIEEEVGQDVGSMDAGYYAFAHNDCREEHPERFERLRSTLEDVINSDEYKSQLEEMGELDAWSYRDADETHEVLLEVNQQVRDAVERYDDYELVE